MEAHADALGLERAAFTMCLDGQMSERVQADVQEGSRLGVTGTPTFFIGIVEDAGVKVEERLVGAQPAARLAAALDAALERARKGQQQRVVLLDVSRGLAKETEEVAPEPGLVGARLVLRSGLDCGDSGSALQAGRSPINTGVMSCLGRDLRRERREANLARTPADRLRLALDLGAADARRYAATHGVTVAEARAVFQRQRQTGRRRSVAHESILR